MKKYQVNMMAMVEASSQQGATLRALLAGNLAKEHLKGEWSSDLFVIEVFEAEEDEDPDAQQELPL
jgi:hypothetical protein